MRYIPINFLSENAELAKTILGHNGEVLLQSGIKLTPQYILKLDQLGICGAYVEDDLSEGIEITSAISEELRSECIKRVSMIYNSPAPKNNAESRANTNKMSIIAEQIVDEILLRKDSVLNLIDIKTYDTYTYFHSVNVAVLSVLIGVGMDITRKNLVELAYSSLMHDIGKIFISNDIINKPGKLTDDEYAILKNHSQDGYDHIRKTFKIPERVARGVVDHHEKVDGTGYPSGKKSGEISLFGRIVSVADVYDALVSDRPYRNGIFPVEALEYIHGGVGVSFDYDVVLTFSKYVAPFPIGTCIMLSDGSSGIVEKNIDHLPLRPLIRVFKNPKGEPITQPYSLDLSESCFSLTIVKTLRM